MHRDKKMGTFIIDRRFKGLGRIKRASGTSDKKTFEAILVMLRQLYDTGSHPTLEEIRDGVISPMVVYGFWKNGRLDHLPSASTLRTVIPTITGWIDTHSVAPKTKTDYKNQIKRFCDVVGEDLSIQDLPKGLKQYRVECDEREIARTFNVCRDVVRAYLNNNYGKGHILYTEIRGVKTLKVEPKKPAVLTVVEFLELVAALPEPYADIARAMVLTGMRVNEVFGEWWVEEDRVVIKGTKTKGSDRIVPLIQPLVQPARGHLAFRKALKKFRDNLTPYAFRHTYTNWMIEAEITRWRRMLYLGHSGADTTDIYERHEVTSYLKEDGAKLSNWIEDRLLDKSVAQTIKEFWGDRLIETDPITTTKKLF